jgi:hypothetical protein
MSHHRNAGQNHNLMIVAKFRYFGMKEVKIRFMKKLGAD